MVLYWGFLGLTWTSVVRGPMGFIFCFSLLMRAVYIDIQLKQYFIDRVCHANAAS